MSDSAVRQGQTQRAGSNHFWVLASGEYVGKDVSKGCGSSPATFNHFAGKRFEAMLWLQGHNGKKISGSKRSPDKQFAYRIMN